MLKVGKLIFILNGTPNQNAAQVAGGRQKSGIIHASGIHCNPQWIAIAVSTKQNRWSLRDMVSGVHLYENLKDAKGYLRG